MKEIQERISIDPEIRFGKPCIKGTRIAVVDILGWLASDMSMEEIVEDFPSIEKEDILAGMSFTEEYEIKNFKKNQLTVNKLLIIFILTNR